MKYTVLAYYCFTPIENPALEVATQKNFFKERDATGRIYISNEGVNCQMSGAQQVVNDYLEWLRADPRFASMRINLGSAPENIFPRMTIKTRKQLVALDQSVDLTHGGQHLSPNAWNEMLEKESDVLLLDVRNDYEWKIGHFEGADLPPLECFRDFPKYVDDLKEKVDPQKTKVMMYCTGGIRCELFSAVMKKKGFDNVYQLEGGVLTYGDKAEKSHWRGKLFVFDDRLTVPIGDHSQAIATCHHCKLPNDTYYNCANMECNDLFICCTSCHEVYLGCCCIECRDAPRVRPYKKDNKPFRRKHLIDAGIESDGSN